MNYVGALKGNEDIGSIAFAIKESLKLSKEWFLDGSDAWDSFKLLRERLELKGPQKVGAAKIPDVCGVFSVPCKDLFYMMRVLSFSM